MGLTVDRQDRRRLVLGSAMRSILSGTIHANTAEYLRVQSVLMLLQSTGTSTSVSREGYALLYN